MKTRDEALALLHEYTKSESLIKHALAVEAGMIWYARHFGLDAKEIEKWGITGLIHDFDYEKYPSAEEHPFKGNEILIELGYPEDVTTAIMGHATYSGVPRETQMAKALFAVDELTGLIMASILVRPDKSIHELKLKSVKKKFKDKRFAAGVNREDVIQGAEELGVELDQHIQNVIDGMKEAARELGVDGS
ncbi:MAG: HAD family hydrolase [Bdellovibrionota bacterium]